MMRPGQSRVGGTGLASGLVLALLLVAVVGCASPGPPRAPSLHLPAVARGLRADRRGETVVLRFGTPVRSTDGFALTGPVTAAVCRAVGDGKCVEVGRKAVAGAVEWVDALPGGLSTGAVRRLTYQVELFNAAGRSAGLSDVSDAAVTAAGEAPRAVEGLRVSGSKAGVRVEWVAEAGAASGAVLVERRELGGGGAAADSGASSAKAGKKISVPVKSLPGRKGRAAGAAAAAVEEPGEEKGVVWLRAAAGEGSAGGANGVDGGGMIDDMAVTDVMYAYRAVRMRVVQVGGVKVEMRSAASAAVEFTLRDVYPPGVPQRLGGAAFPVEGSDAVAVDLIWQPVSEADVVGYHVYRQVVGGAAAARKLNEAVVALPSFHDVGVERGVRYRYTVVAVDAKGNVSAASEAVEVEAPR